MQITFEEMLQYLDSILAQKVPEVEILNQVKAWSYAAHKHVNDAHKHVNDAHKHVNAAQKRVSDLYEGEENEQEKRTKKEEEKEVLDKNQSSGSLKRTRHPTTRHRYQTTRLARTGT